MQEVDLHSAAAGGHVELADQLHHPGEGARAGDDDELVGPLLGDDLADLHRSAGTDCARRADRGLPDARRRRSRLRVGDAEGAGPGPAAGLRSEDLLQLLLQGLRARVLHLHDVDLFRAARLIERDDEPLEAAHVEAQVGDDERVGREDLEVRVAAGELVDGIAHLVRFDVAKLEELGDHLLGGRSVLPLLEEGGDVRARRLLLLGNRRVGEQGDLPRYSLGKDEVAARDLADELDDLGQVLLVEVELDRVGPLRRFLGRSGGGRRRPAAGAGPGGGRLHERRLRRDGRPVRIGQRARRLRGLRLVLLLRTLGPRRRIHALPSPARGGTLLLGLLVVLRLLRERRDGNDQRADKEQGGRRSHAGPALTRSSRIYGASRRDVRSRSRCGSRRGACCRSRAPCPGCSFHSR